MKLKYLIVILFLIINFNSYAEEKTLIKYIDLDFVFQNSTVGKKIGKNSSNKKNKKIEEFKKIEANLVKERDDILSKKNILEPKEFEIKVASHQKKIQEFKIKQKKDFDNIGKLNLDLTKNFMKKVDKILVNYAKDNKIDLVLNKGSLILSNSKLDITKEILAIVEKEIKKME